jgi:hypothetical protein
MQIDRTWRAFNRGGHVLGAECEVRFTRKRTFFARRLNLSETI